MPLYCCRRSRVVRGAGKNFGWRSEKGFESLETVLLFFLKFSYFFRGKSAGVLGKLQEVVLLNFVRQACKSSRWELKTHFF
jgi:hypothetical protein